MLHRFSFWTALFVFAVVGAARAQTPSSAQPATAQTTMSPGQIVAKQVTGKVSMILDGVTTELKNEAAVSQAATVVTANDSSVILVFSNGATTQLGADTTLVIEEFLQDPFQQTVAVASLTSEPTTSHTKLRLTKGELVGKVAHLKHDQGSYFTVQTPVGAAGIRGTTFRIVFRPSGTGQAFAVFSLSTVEGNVNFQQGGQGGQAQPGTSQTPAPADNQGQAGQQGQAQGQGQASPQGQTAGQGGGVGQQASAGGVAVTGGQEVVVTVSVTVNPTTGGVVVTAPATITSTQPISVQTQSAIVQQAQTLAATAATTSFTPSTPAAPSNSGTQPQQQQQGDNNSSSGNGNSNNSNSNPTPNQSENTPGNSNTTPTTPTNPAPTTPTLPQVNPPVPPVTVTPPTLTPGAGRPQG